MDGINVQLYILTASFKYLVIIEAAPEAAEVAEAHQQPK